MLEKFPLICRNILVWAADSMLNPFTSTRYSLFVFIPNHVWYMDHEPYFLGLTKLPSPVFSWPDNLVSVDRFQYRIQNENRYRWSFWGFICCPHVLHDVCWNLLWCHFFFLPVPSSYPRKIPNTTSDSFYTLPWQSNDVIFQQSKFSKLIFFNRW